MKKIYLFLSDLCSDFFLWIVIFIPIVAIVVGLTVWRAPKTITLSEAQYRCVAAIPDGIGSKCETFQLRVK
jgi:hypothetical protein